MTTDPADPRVRAVELTEKPMTPDADWSLPADAMVPPPANAKLGVPLVLVNPRISTALILNRVVAVGVAPATVILLSTVKLNAADAAPVQYFVSNVTVPESRRVFTALA